MFKKIFIIIFLIAGFIIAHNFYSHTTTPITNLDSAETSIFSEFFTPKDEVPLVDPQQAPADIKKLVLRGYDIFCETNKSLPNNVRAKMDCASCHLAAGNTLGGKKGGIPLVGITLIYPQMKKGEEYTLKDRVNDCFKRSMNGVPLDEQSPEMNALISYMTWISSSVPKDSKVPWMGIKKLKSDHVPDPINGKEIFAMKCAPCHGADGQGQPRKYDLSYPPLWGPESFNDSAGMNDIDKISAFVFMNMPYTEPDLTIEQALDVSAYVTGQPRPKLNPPEK